MNTNPQKLLKRAIIVGLSLRLGLVVHAGAQVVPAQAILFDRYDQTRALDAINPDRTGEHQVTVNLPEAGFPTWSKDGQLLALSSVNPATPFALSRNIFVVNLQTAQINQITHFADTVNGGGGAGSNEVVSACVLPWYKAFSPDRTRLAVAGVVFTGITQSIGTNTAPDATLLSGFQGTPALQIYGMDGTSGALVTLCASGTESIHAGDGVDWAPDQDLLVYPKDTQVQVIDNIGQQLVMPLTILVLMPPVNDPITSGKATQLTHPQATVTETWSGPIDTWETDFQPGFSPDGKHVAYVRAHHTLIGASFFTQAHSLRIVNVDGSNDHQIVAFDQGSCVSHLSWSPDGKKLAFDVGHEAISLTGAPMAMADATTCSIWTINIDGTGLEMLRTAPSGWPAWYPGAAIGPAATPPRLDIGLVPQPGGSKLLLSWLVGDANFHLQSSPTLGPGADWYTAPVQPTIADGQASLMLTPSTGPRFYRLIRQ